MLLHMQFILIQKLDISITVLHTIMATMNYNRLENNTTNLRLKGTRVSCTDPTSLVA